jgi:hypothetical protein
MNSYLSKEPSMPSHEFISPAQNGAVLPPAIRPFTTPPPLPLH